MGEVRRESHDDGTGAVGLVQGDVEEGARDIEVAEHHVFDISILDCIGVEGCHNHLVDGLIHSGGKGVEVGVRRLAVTTSSEAGRYLDVGPPTGELFFDEHAAVDADSICRDVLQVDWGEGLVLLMQRRR